VHRFDNRLPEPVRLPSPRGWYEPLCCGSIVLLLFVGLVLIALLSR